MRAVARPPQCGRAIVVGWLVLCLQGAAVGCTATPAPRAPPPMAGGKGQVERTTPPALELTPVAAGADLPDPAMRSGRRALEFELRYDRGQLRLAGVKELCLPALEASSRRIGRYALEIGIGKELIDRVRFDFPLLAVHEPSEAAALHRPPHFAPGARTVARVRMLADDRAVWARLLDRATREAASLPWPPRPQTSDCPSPAP